LPAIIAFGPALQAVLTATLVRKFVGYPTALASEREVLRFSLLVCVSCLLSSAIAANALYGASKISASEWLLNWATWYVGDTIGTLIFAPLVLIWRIRAQDLRRKLAVTIPLLVTFFAVVTL
jgi:integral membrane sensor domain MASE1